MSIEQMLRENLEAAAEAIVVPPAKEMPAPRALPIWRRPLVFAAAGALAVLGLSVPIFLMAGPFMDDPQEPAATFAAPATTSPTTTVPIVVSTTSAPFVGGSTEEEGVAIGELDRDTHHYRIIAVPGDEEEAPTATATLVVDSAGEELARAVIGEPSAFFWHSISEPGGLCLLTTWDDGGQEVIGVQILLSPSLGCSDPYVYEFSGETLVARPAEAADIANMFVEAWRQGSDAALEILATPEAAAQAAAIEPPEVASQAQCEGAAGSIYCTWQVDGGEMVVRVSNVEPAPRVTEFTVQ